jgi:hypothetical protein
MGTKCAPAISNIFLSILEKKWLNIFKPLYFSRFIDDLFIIDHRDISSITQYFGSLKLNIVKGKSVQFLDLKISIDNVTNSLIFSLYIKPTNTFAFLLYSSNHPDFIFKNIPKSLFIRIRRVCTFISDYLFFARKLTFQLVKRGYNFFSLRKISNMVLNLDRNKLLPYKEKKDFLNNNLFLRIPFDKNFSEINNIVKKTWSDLSSEGNYIFKNFDLTILNTMQPNLISLFIFNFNFPSIKTFYFRKCQKKDCKTCNFASTDKYILLKNYFYFPIECLSNCSTINCIYIIRCIKCNCFYIGETKNIKQRIYNHIYSIKSFKPYIKKNSCISFHFNLLGHNYLKDFKFYVFLNNIENDKERFKFEKLTIEFFNKLEIKILNELNN